MKSRKFIIYIFVLCLIKHVIIKQRTNISSYSIRNRTFSCTMYTPEKLNWCNLENFYIKGHDRVYYPAQVDTNHNVFRYGIAPFEGVTNITSFTTNYMDQHIKSDHSWYVNVDPNLTNANGIDNAITIKGETWISNCWRQKPNTAHPNHFMMGIGPIISHILYNPSIELPDTIILHQCIYRETVKLQHTIMQIFYKILGDRRKPRVINIPYSEKSPTYFVEHAKFQPQWMGALPLGQTGSYDSKIKNKFSNYLPGLLKVPFDITSACQNNKLRIGIFYRTGGALRRFVNMKEVIETAKKISSSVFTFTTNGSMTILEQAKAYNSFDILIAPHGSQHFNAIWINHYPTASIEICVNTFNVGHWKWITEHSDWSEGHVPDLNSTPNCLHQADGINCDMIVNLTKLEQKIRDAQDFICNKTNNATASLNPLKREKGILQKSNPNLTPELKSFIKLNRKELNTGDMLEITSNICQYYRITFQSIDTFHTEYGLGCASCSNCVIKTHITRPGIYNVSARSILQEDSLHLTDVSFIKNSLREKKMIPVFPSQIKVISSKKEYKTCDLKNWVDGDWVLQTDIIKNSWVDTQWKPTCHFVNENNLHGWIHIYGDSNSRGVHRYICKQLNLERHGAKDANGVHRHYWCGNKTLLITQEWWYIENTGKMLSKFKPTSFWHVLTKTSFNKPRISIVSFGSHADNIAVNQAKAVQMKIMNSIPTPYIIQFVTAVSEFKIPNTFDKNGVSQGVTRNNDRINAKNQISKKLCDIMPRCITTIDLFSVSLKGVPWIYADAVHVWDHRGFPFYAEIVLYVLSKTITTADLKSRHL